MGFRLIYEQNQSDKTVPLFPKLIRFTWYVEYENIFSF